MSQGQRRQNSQRNHWTGTDRKRKDAQPDWRSNLYSAFVDNLSLRVSKGALWDAFCDYGRVVDVYIPRFSKRQNIKGTTFAFVRYKFKSELMIAIEGGNNRRIDGWQIKVKKAIFTWKERSSSQKRQRGEEKNGEAPREAMTSLTIRDNRSYRDALMGANHQLDERLKELSPSGETSHRVKEPATTTTPEEVNYDLEIPKSEMEWLDRSAIARIRGSLHFNEICKALVREGIKCQLCPTGGVSVLLIFESKEEMVIQLNGAKVSGWFDCICPWNSSPMKREVAVWVSLEDVPLLIWHEKFFTSLGNRWGSFVCFDECTLNRKRFDTARFLVLVENRCKIPSTVTVQVRGVSCRILVSVEDPESLADNSQYNSDDQSSDEEDDSPGKVNFLSNSTVEKSKINADWMSWIEVDIQARTASDTDCDVSRFSSKLSKEELAGGNLLLSEGEMCLITIESSRMEEPAIDRLVIDGYMIDHMKDKFDLGHRRLPISNGPHVENEIMDNGPHVENEILDNGVTNGLATPDFSDGSVGSRSKSKRFTGLLNKTKKQNLKMRKKRRNRKGLSELVYGEKDHDACNSELSIVDEDIEHRNAVILKEAETTWEVSSVLGLTFDRDKNHVIEVFKELEDNNRSVRRGRV